MVLLVLAYLGGVLTILSPCILPILPFTFARADRPFRSNGLPLLLSMAVTFAAIATLTVVGGGWLVRANQLGRYVAVAVFALLGLTLLLPSLAERLSRPLVALGSRLTRHADSEESSGGIWQPLLLGVATGLLWAPCAGPILGLILTGAALQGPSAHTSLLLLLYAAGAATSLAVVLLAGGKVFAALKRGLGAEEWVRRGLGIAVLVGVAAVAFGLDRGVLTRISLAGSSGIEQRLLDKLHPPRLTPAATGEDDLVSSQTLPSLAGATAWINSPPLTPESLRGKVVVVDFWTYSCINCLRSLPYVHAWYDKYKDSGLVVIGVHTPEFAFEKDEANVRKAVHDLGVDYPVAMDNNYAIWDRFDNSYWPAHYFFDATGKFRHAHFGEGKYDESEEWIQRLLKERDGNQVLPGGVVAVQAQGAEAAASDETVISPETYVGYSRAEGFASPGGLKQDVAAEYRAPAQLRQNEWALAGRWTDAKQVAMLQAAGGKIVYRFHARDLHLVLGPGADGKPVRFRVMLDGKAPGEDHGSDTDAQGNGTITGQRLYQLIRQQGAARDRTFTIEFLDGGAQAFSFTFG